MDATTPQRMSCQGSQCEEGADASWDSEVVIGLADPLGEEVGCARRPPRHIEIERGRHLSAGSADCPHQLQVLKERIAVVAVGREQDATTNGEGAGKVTRTSDRQ
jgi:hypothetical protein